VEIGHCDRGGDPEPDDPADEGTTAILAREPPQLDPGGNGGPNSDDASDNGAGE